jgi:hypothetical protein
MNADNERPDGTKAPNFENTNFIPSPKHMELISQAVSCNTIGTEDEAAATEKAMLKFIRRCGVDYHHLR